MMKLSYCQLVENKLSASICGHLHSTWQRLASLLILVSYYVYVGQDSMIAQGLLPWSVTWATSIKFLAPDSFDLI